MAEFDPISYAKASRNTKTMAEIANQVNYISLTNLIGNGNFTNGLTGWQTFAYQSMTVENNIVTVKGLGTGSTIRINTVPGAIPAGLPVGTRLYITYEIEVPSTAVVGSYVGLRDVTAGITIRIDNTVNNGIMRRYSNIIELDKVTADAYIMSYINFGNNATQKDQIVRAKKYMAIILPDYLHDVTVEEFEELLRYFPDMWFSGTAQIPTMLWMNQYGKYTTFAPEAHDKQVQANKIVEITEKLDITNRNLQSMLGRKSGITSSSQTITLRNTDRHKLILHLHKGANNGYDTVNDVYLANVENDFSDVRIKTDTGEMLPYHVIYKGNIDIIPDARLGMNHLGEVYTDSGKNMYAAHSGGIYRSADNGITWVKLNAIDIENPYIVRVTNGDNILFFGKNGILYRSAPPYTSYAQVLDITNNGTYTGCYTLGANMVEHPDGEIFFGGYQNERHIRIWRSLDRGQTWELVLNILETYQHCHSLYVDITQNPIVIYAGCDGGGGVYKTSDKGATWTDLRALNPNIPKSTDRGVLYASPKGYRLFGGETSMKGGYSILKTEDDINFRPVLGTGGAIFNVNEFAGKLIATANSADNTGYKYTAIYISEDDGETWTQMYISGPITSAGANDGYRYMSKDIYASTDYEQLIMGCQSEVLSPIRAISNENTHFAEIIVDVPDGCTELTIESGYLCSYETKFYNDYEVSNEKLVYLPLNEGGRFIKELVSGRVIEGNFKFHDVGKHMYHHYPYITAPADRKSIKLNSLYDGIDVDISLLGLSAFTISFWGRIGRPEFDIISSDNTYLRVQEAYKLYIGTTYIGPLRYPVSPDAYAKFDIVVDAANNQIKTYENGYLKYIHNVDATVMVSLTSLTKIKVLKVRGASDNDAIQHFIIYAGVVSDEEIFNAYHCNTRDNYPHI